MHNLAALTLLASGIVLASDGSLELRGTVTGTQDISDLHVQLFGVELPVTATGSVSTRGQFRFRDLEPGTEVVAFPADIILLGGGGRGGDAPGGGSGEYDQRPVSMPRSAQRQSPAPSAPDDFGQGVTDDDVPF